MGYEELFVEAKQIQAFTEMPFADDPALIIERGNAIAGWLARSASMLAEAKKVLNSAKTSEISKLIKGTLAENKLSAQVQNSLLNSICENEQYLVDWLTEINKTLKHQLDWCRSALSKYKAELSITQMGREFN